jgi:coatomer subunit beta
LSAGAFDITEELGGTNDHEKAEEQEEKIYQLTGYSDPIYAEAFVTVHHYDILLKIVLINRTAKTIQNVNVELLTQGNIKVVEKPVAVTLRGQQTTTVKSSLKVSSTDNGAIYGYLTFDSPSGNVPFVININEIQIDFINALQPAECTELEFKKKWAEYEWENKVQVSTPITDLKQYVEHFADSMNIKLMTTITEAD